MSALRPRPRLDPCARCGGNDFLRVAPVREHGAGGEPVAMAALYVAERRTLGPLARAVSCVGPAIEQRPVGSFLVVLCLHCGEARWYARDLDAETVAQLGHATVGPCVDCGDPRAVPLGRAKTRGAGGQPSELRVLTWTGHRWGWSGTRSTGHFATFACRGCGRTSWVAGGIDGRIADRATTGHGPCRRCDGTARLTVDPMNEDGATLRVLYDKQHLRELRIGCYALSICTGCGTTDWRARDIESLRPDPRLGIARLHADEGHEGPYR